MCPFHRNLISASCTPSGGKLKIETANASGSKGVSGDLWLQTGDVIDKAARGDAGNVGIITGSSANGKGGDIIVGVGDSNQADGGNINLGAGNSAGNLFYGGTLNMESGESDFHSGEINLRTPESRNGNSGSINIASGSTQTGQSGSIFLSTGDG